MESDFNGEYFKGRSIESKHLIEVLQWITDLNIQGKVLDVGCSLVPARVYAGRELYNKDFYGLDLSYPILNNTLGYGRDILIIASILNIPFDKGEFDIVICYDVLEHMNNAEEVEKAMKELKRVCSKYVLISIPVIGDPNLLKDKTHHIKKTKEWWINKSRNNIGNILEVPKYWLFKEQLILIEVKHESK